MERPGAIPKFIEQLGRANSGNTRYGEEQAIRSIRSRSEHGPLLTECTERAVLGSRLTWVKGPRVWPGLEGAQCIPNISTE